MAEEFNYSKLPTDGLPHWAKGRAIELLNVKQDMEIGMSIVLFGQTKSGKTEAFKYIMQELGLKRWSLMVPSGALFRSYRNVVPDACQFSYFSSQHLENIIAFQSQLTKTNVKKMEHIQAACLKTKEHECSKKRAELDLYIQKYKSKLEQYCQDHLKDQEASLVKKQKETLYKKKIEKCEAQYQAFVANCQRLNQEYCREAEQRLKEESAVGVGIDDVSERKDILKAPVLHSLVTKNRHVDLTFALLLHSPMLLPKDYRTSISWLGFMSLPSGTEIEELRKHYRLSNIFDSPKEFQKVVEYVEKINTRAKNHGRYSLWFNLNHGNERLDRIRLLFTPKPDPIQKIAPIGDEILNWLSSIMIDEKKLEHIEEINQEMQQEEIRYRASQKKLLQPKDGKKKAPKKPKRPSDPAPEDDDQDE